METLQPVSTEPKRDNSTRTILLIVAVILILLAAMAVTLMVVLSRASDHVEEARQVVVDGASLKEIAKVLHIYASEHDDRLPAHVSEVLPLLAGHEDVLAGGFPRQGNLPNDPPGDAHQPTYVHGGYIYIYGDVRLNNLPASYILALSRRVHDKQLRRNVLYVDGSVINYKEDELSDLLDEQQALRKEHDLPLIDLSRIDLANADGE